MQNPGQILLRVWLRVHDRPFQHLEVHKADGLLEHHAWVKNKHDWIIGERSNTFKLQTSNTRLKRARKRQGKKLTSPEENCPHGNYVQGKQRAGGSVEDLLLCMHEPQEQGARPAEIHHWQTFNRYKPSDNAF